MKRGKKPVNIDRDTEICRLRTEYHYTFEAIGNLYGISRERVRQVLRKGGIDEPRYRRGTSRGELVK